MKQAIADVRAFHERFEQPVASVPSVPDRSRLRLRRRLIREEHIELRAALNILVDEPWRKSMLEHVADGIADSIYVLIGTALELGIPLDRVWDEVHAANMRKEGGGTREDGKILKPEGWTPPDIAKALWGRPLDALGDASAEGEKP